MYRRPGTPAHYRSYCSVVCRKAHYQDKHSACPVCGKSIVKKNKGQTYCSHKCANIGRTGISYHTGQKHSKALRHARLWASLIEQRGPQCERCFYNRNPKILQVHHRLGRRVADADSLDNLELLCPNCHAEQHYGASVWRDVDRIVGEIGREVMPLS